MERSKETLEGREADEKEPQAVVGSEGGAAPWASPARLSRDGRGPVDKSPSATEEPPVAERLADE